MLWEHKPIGDPDLTLTFQLTSLVASDNLDVSSQIGTLT